MPFGRCFITGKSLMRKIVINNSKKVKEKLFLICFTFVLSTVGLFAQSKKEQIEILTQKVDSFVQVTNSKNFQLDSMLKVNHQLVESLLNNKIRLDSVSKGKLKLQGRLDSLISIHHTQKENLENTLSELSLLKLKIQELDKKNQNLENQNREILSSLEKNKQLLEESQKKLRNKEGEIKKISYIDSRGNKVELSFYDPFSESTFSINVFFSKSEVDDTSNQRNRVLLTGNYKNGLRDGKWTLIDYCGNIEYEGNYVNGRKNGVWTNYSRCSIDNNDIESHDDRFLNLLDMCSIIFGVQSPQNLVEKIEYDNEHIVETRYINKVNGKLEFKLIRDLQDRFNFLYPNGQKMFKVGIDIECFDLLDINSYKKIIVYNEKGSIIKMPPDSELVGKLGDECPCQ